MAILGVSGSQGPLGCSSWSKMVPGHWYTVPHYATALPGCILGFKIPNLVKIWPEMPQRCSFWGVFWGHRAPRGPRACLSWSKIVPDHWYTVPNCHNPWTILNTPGELLGAQKKPKYTPKRAFWGHFWPNFHPFWYFKAQNATWEGCGLVWDSIPVAWNHLGPT